MLPDSERNPRHILPCAYHRDNFSPERKDVAYRISSNKRRVSNKPHGLYRIEIN